MKSPTKNYLIDIIAFICFVLLVSTGIILYYDLPKGSGHFNTIWTLDRHEWGDIHFWIAVIFLIVMAFHVIFHWRWIVSLTKGKKHSKSVRRVALGLVGFLALMAIAIAPIITPVESSIKGNTNEYDNVGPAMTRGTFIRGSMTLKDIETQMHVPLSYFITALKLPENISNDIPLKDLKNEYEFNMEDIRKAVDDYRP